MNPPRAQPLYFGTADQPLFGWLHAAAAGARSSIGMVLCYPFGNESLCIHRTYRHCAEAVASVGIPALRFDYQGTGDSAGMDTDPGQLEAWTASVRSAVALLRLQTGVERVCLLGTRLGATIAMLAARDCTDVFALIAVAPVVNCRRYLRELRALALSRPLPTPPPEAGSTPKLLESAGFALTEATQAELASVDLLQISQLPIMQAYILQRSDLPSDDSLLRHLNSLDIHTREELFTGYVEMMLDPHDTVIPGDLLDKVVAWLKLVDAPRANPMANPVVASMQRPATHARMPFIRETATYLDESQGLFAIVCEPDIVPSKATDNRRQVLLLLNAGAVHHVGPNRLYVTLARALAAQGLTVIRLDIAGLGDSLTKPGKVENATYPPLACEDIAQAVAYVRKTPGVTNVHLAGICSGGYHSLKSAAGGLALTSITVINPQTFFWKEGMSLAQREHLITAESIRYQSRVLEISAWLKLLRGNVDVRAGAYVMRRRLALRVVHALRELARWLHIPLSDDLTVEIDSICRRGTHIQFVFSASDPGLSMLLEQGGRLVTQLQRRGAIGIDVIDGADHTFTSLWARNTLTRLLSSRFAPHAV